ncbi:hypothetical protein [Paenirhodobacter sp.]|uniref:hypothetical protein n=1 Tax=Paenirhodobacter sp. TaxID=1965326 RepID=UPI003B40A264
MKRMNEERATALAKGMAMICVRNTIREDLHAGRVPITKTGDFSDVHVIDGMAGRERDTAGARWHHILARSGASGTRLLSFGVMVS